MDPLSTARYGMMAAESRLAASARRVAAPDVEGSDLAGEAVEQAVARSQFAANAQVARIADQMWRALTEIQAR